MSEKLFNIGTFLDRADEATGYLLSINGVSTASRHKTQLKFSALRQLCPNPKKILSLGVGQGEELHVLRDLFPSANGVGPRIIGIDIAKSALSSARERSDDFSLESRLVMGNGAKLPFAESSLSTAVMSAVLHEVYSYHEDGILKWQECIKEAFRALEPGGVLFVRDFLTPDNPEAKIAVRFKTQIAADFFKYFLHQFRAFSTYEGFKPADQRQITEQMYGVDQTRPVLRLGQVSELVVKFFYFYGDYVTRGTLTGFSPEWKEINERYFIIDEQHPYGFDFLTYIETASAAAGVGPEFFPACTHMRVDTRPDMAEMLREHFELALLGDTAEMPTSQQLLISTTAKMEFALEKRAL